MACNSGCSATRFGKAYSEKKGYGEDYGEDPVYSSRAYEPYLRF